MKYAKQRKVQVAHTILYHTDEERRTKVTRREMEVALESSPSHKCVFVSYSTVAVGRRREAHPTSFDVPFLISYQGRRLAPHVVMLHAWMAWPDRSGRSGFFKENNTVENGYCDYHLMTIIPVVNGYCEYFA